MKILAGFVISLFLCGCQVDPYTHSPTWTGTDWYDAGMEDALAGFAAKDNETLAQTYNDRAVNRSYYLRGYSEGQRKTCEPGLMFARGISGKTFPASCENVENVKELHEKWQAGADENANSTRLN